MNNIKTLQPYKLYSKFASAKKTVKTGIFAAIGLIVVLLIFNPEFWFLPLILFALALPMMFYDPTLSSTYVPGKTYKWAREQAAGRHPDFLIKAIGYGGFIAGIIMDIAWGEFPLWTIVSGGVFGGLAYAIRKKPEWFIDKQGKTQNEHHQNVDYNVKVDLNEIYGIHDKMVLSYQNFHFNQKKLNKGDFLLGVSAQGVYFAHKANSVEKTLIKYEDIDTLGLLAAIGNKFIFSIKSKSNVEINIIIDQDDSLVVSPYKLIDKMLDSIDSFLVNGHAATGNTSRRRRSVDTSAHTMTQTASQQTVEAESGRSIDLGIETNASEAGTDQNTRVVDIEFTDDVMAELAEGEMITMNRIIEL